MTTTQNISIVFVQKQRTADGKVNVFKRKFNTIAPDATVEKIQKFQTLLTQLTGENYDTVEIIKTETLN